MKYFTEIEKLANGLEERNIEFTIKGLWDGYQIVADGWDVVCHSGSYGHEENLLEIMGGYVEVEDDDVEGYLTAEEILNRIDKEKENKMNIERDTASFVAEEIIRLAIVLDKDPLEIAEDFLCFSDNIDCIKEREGLTEEEALARIASCWTFPKLG